MKEYIKNNDAVYYLRNAIIKSAANDYLTGREFYYKFGIEPIPELRDKGSLKKYRKYGQAFLDSYVQGFFYSANNIQRRCEDAKSFFLSKDYELLQCNIDPIWLLNKLDKLAQQNATEWIRNPKKVIARMKTKIRQGDIY